MASAIRPTRGETNRSVQFLCGCLASAALVSCSQPCDSFVIGPCIGPSALTVTDSVTGAGVPQVKVSGGLALHCTYQANATQCRTALASDELTPGEVTLQITAPGYAPTTVVVNVPVQAEANESTCGVVPCVWLPTTKVQMKPDCMFYRPATDPKPVPKPPSCKSNGCGDGDACTVDWCDAMKGQCVHANVNDCDAPGQPCTLKADCVLEDPCLVATCKGGVCQLDVNASMPGCCEPPFNTDCDDGNTCTTDFCYQEDGEKWATCKHKCLGDCCISAGDCAIDTSDLCATFVCASGCCVGGPRKAECCLQDGHCDDGDPCTTDGCKLATRVCQHETVAGCCVEP